MKKHISEEEILKLIKKSEWGEYNELHEWEPDYRYHAKIKLFRELLEKTSTAFASGKKILKEHFFKLRDECGRFKTPPDELFKLLENIEIKEI